MNAEMDRYLSIARAHDLARDRASALRGEATARLWSQLDQALVDSAGGAERAARRLWARLRRRGAWRSAGA